MSLSRRKFLTTAAVGGAALATGGLSALLPRAYAGPRTRQPGRTSKIVIVGFGGGCRLSESFGDPAYIPTMAQRLFPQGTLYLNCRNELATNHYGGSAAVVSGSWQALKAVDNNGPDSPTIFEVYRRSTGAPAGKTWAITQGGNFAYLSRSQGHGYTAEEAAVVIWSGIATNRMLRSFLEQRAKGATVSFAGFTGPDGEETNYEGEAQEKDPRELSPRRLLALKRTEEMVNSLDPATAAYLLELKGKIPNQPGP
ncbi:MAG TPA: twin-arginine translocation signal domain-containing protein, partial [bacterium]|nr:twin-arginine translocation signal domain-containing protein [bacterium]